MGWIYMADRKDLWSALANSVKEVSGAMNYGDLFL
jgi:hypothetical protein